MQIHRAGRLSRRDKIALGPHGRVIREVFGAESQDCNFLRAILMLPAFKFGQDATPAAKKPASGHVR